jgi:hypothetical protein
MTILHRRRPTPTEQFGPTAREKAQQKARENEDAIVEMRKLEAGDPPTDLDDWPSGPAKYLTYGNEEDDVYGVGVTAKLGPANLARFSDGSIAIDGKKVDNPEDYKGKPLAGGPTDTDTGTSS